VKTYYAKLGSKFESTTKSYLPGVPHTLPTSEYLPEESPGSRRAGSAGSFRPSIPQYLPLSRQLTMQSLQNRLRMSWRPSGRVALTGRNGG